MKKIKGVFIDAKHTKLIEIEITFDMAIEHYLKDIPTIAHIINHENGKRDVIFSGDNAIANGKDYSFSIEEKRFYGSGIVFGEDPENGETIDSHLSALGMSQHIIF
jgi:hypothetical protein